MVKELLLGILLGVALVVGGVYLYFSSGQMPVATSAPPIFFEKKLAHMALNAHLAKLPHPDPPLPADEQNLLAGAQVYKRDCAVCHGLPGAEKTDIAAGMAPEPPQLFRGVGVTDDAPWESYWKVRDGIRMTGMPGFKDRLTEPQMWQVSVLVKNADKIPASVHNALTTPITLSLSPGTPPAAGTIQIPLSQ
jgi:thiosulfate dehydrogenase